MLLSDKLIELCRSHTFGKWGPRVQEHNQRVLSEGQINEYLSQVSGCRAVKNCTKKIFSRVPGSNNNSKNFVLDFFK
jgi:hypothetical protein